jgi:putative component of membrane protein insertase Oxa1/YidC/SpoIIIJ protein YidD
MQTNAISTFPRQTASSLITIYQKHISPHKGFSCAYRVMSNGESCSQYTKRLILEQGLGRSLPLIRERFQACKAASQTLKARRQNCHAIQSESSEGDNEPDVPTEGQEPEGNRRKNNGRSSSSRSVTNSTDTSNFCADSSCDSLYCTDLGCDAIDCGSLDCGGANCSSFDCGDCGGGDCGSCGDFGS